MRIQDCWIRWVECGLMARGKHKGRPIDDVAREHPEYLRWLLGEEIRDADKAAVRDALAVDNARRGG